MCQIFYIRTRTRSKCLWSVNVEKYINCNHKHFMKKTRLIKYLDSFNPFNTESPRNQQSGIREIFDCGIRNPRLWNLEFSSMNPESRFQDLRTRNLESSIWNPESTDCLGWITWYGMGWCVCGVGIVSIQITDCHTQLSLAVSGSPFKTLAFRGRAAGCGMVFCPVALNSEHAGNIFYQGLDTIRGRMICKTGIDIWTTPNRRTLSEFI